MKRRRRILYVARSVDKFIAEHYRDDDELDRIQYCLSTFIPEDGVSIVFSDYPGDHKVTECGRFLFVYQYSGTEIRVKAARLTVDYDDA